MADERKLAESLGGGGFFPSQIETLISCAPMDRMAEAMMKSWQDTMDAQRPYRWTLAEEITVSERLYEGHAITETAQTWKEPEKRIRGPFPLTFLGCEPDGMDALNCTRRWEVADPYGEKAGTKRYYGSLEEAQAFVRVLNFRAKHDAEINRVLAVLEREGFHHGPEYLSCEPKTCRQCADAAMEILGLVNE